MNISKQVAIVSGSNRGLGKELALELLARGAKVYAGANPETIDLSGAIPLQLDITDPKSVMAAADVAGVATLLITIPVSATGPSPLTGELYVFHLEFYTP
ncbi:short-chain dehydrogenase, partial [Paenibacillus sp. 28ISP30-2]|nr:short-chain dehydrogenase [Paenibacillus sp. 28ISP30-2]